VIAIDLGSNTLRVTQLDCQSGIFGASFEKIVKTADGLVQTGVIGSEAVERVIVAISEAKRCIDFSGDKVVAVTTEAIRRASNSEAVLSRIKEDTGISFEVISGEKEAALTLLAVEHRLKHLDREKGDRDHSSFVLVDIGGGSTELIFRYSDQIVTKSFPVGIVTVAQQCETLDKIDGALPALMKEMKQFAQSVVSRHGALDAFIATAGTPTTVAAMKLGQNYATYDPASINGTSLEIEELDHYLKVLLGMPFEEREVTVGVGRSDLIAAGILIFRQLFILLGMKECVVIDDGLREGLALEKCIEMKRLAFKMKLNPGQKQAYIERHDKNWTELKNLLKESGISEYSIFLDEETSTLFAFQKVSGEGSLQDLGKTEIVQKW